jgi:hypothetical protein
MTPQHPSLIYATYDLAGGRPSWLDDLRRKGWLVFDPFQALDTQEELYSLTDVLRRTSSLLDPGELETLGLNPLLCADFDTTVKAKDGILSVEPEANAGYYEALQDRNYYALVRSSLVLADGDSAGQSDVSTDLLLARQMRIPAVLVSHRCTIPPWLRTYSDVVTDSKRLEWLVNVLLPVLPVIDPPGPDDALSVEELVSEEPPQEP